jgi:transposase
MNRKLRKIFEQEDYSAEFQEIKGLIKKTKVKWLSQRYYTIFYHLKGYKNKEIGRLLSLDEHTIGIYINKYNENGVSGLNRHYSSGAPRYLDKEQEKELVNTVTKNTPDEVGFEPRKNWNINIIRQWVKKTYGVEYSHSGMAAVLYRLNLSFTRPAYVLCKANAKKQEEFKEKFKEYKKNY